MHVRLLGGPHHGQTFELASNLIGEVVRHHHDIGGIRYTLRVSEGVGNRPSSIGYFVLDSLDAAAAQKLIMEAVRET